MVIAIVLRTWWEGITRSEDDVTKSTANLVSVWRLSGWGQKIPEGYINEEGSVRTVLSLIGETKWLTKNAFIDLDRAFRMLASAESSFPIPMGLVINYLVYSCFLLRVTRWEKQWSVELPQVSQTERWWWRTAWTTLFPLYERAL